MELTFLGTTYGGWWIDVERVPTTGTVIDAGVGTDTSFAEALLMVRPQLRVIGIDHTDETAAYIEKRNIPNYTLLRAAVAPPGQRTVQMHYHRTRSGSESLYGDHEFADAAATYEVPAVDLGMLVAALRPCVVKLDVEGAEYETYEGAFGAPQVCIEAHHRYMSSRTWQDTENMVQAFVDFGYSVEHHTETDEFLFVLREGL